MQSQFKQQGFTYMVPSILGGIFGAGWGSISTFARFLTAIAGFNFWGDWALGYAFSQIWDFPNVCLYPKILSVRSFGNSFGNSHTKFSFYLWLVGSIRKHCKVLKFYDQDCWFKWMRWILGAYFPYIPVSSCFSLFYLPVLPFYIFTFLYHSSIAKYSHKNGPS